MLKHITWQQFLLAATLLTFLWYVAVMLLLYRKELKNFLTGKKNIAERNAEPPSDQTEGPVLPEENGNPEQDLMGKAKLPEGISIMGMDELRFKGKDDDKDRQLGKLPDLLEEMKQVFQILRDEEGTKADFLDLLENFKPALKEIRTATNQQSINEFIIQQVPYALSTEELESIWE